MEMEDLETEIEILVKTNYTLFRQRQFRKICDRKIYNEGN